MGLWPPTCSCHAPSLTWFGAVSSPIHSRGGRCTSFRHRRSADIKSRLFRSSGRGRAGVAQATHKATCRRGSGDSPNALLVGTGLTLLKSKRPPRKARATLSRIGPCARCPLYGPGGQHRVPAPSPARNTRARNPHTLVKPYCLPAAYPEPTTPARAAPTGEASGTAFPLLPLPASPVPTTPLATCSARSSRSVPDQRHACALRSTTWSALWPPAADLHGGRSWHPGRRLCVPGHLLRLLRRSCAPLPDAASVGTLEIAAAACSAVDSVPSDGA